MKRPEVLADPEIVDAILKMKFNPDFTYQALLSGKGEDAEEFQTMFKAYIVDSKAYFKDLKDKQEEADTKNQEQILENIRKDYIGSGKTSASGISAIMVASGQFTETEANKKEKAVQVFMDNNMKAQRGSKTYNEALNLIQTQVVTLPSQVDDLIIMVNLIQN